MLNEGRHSELLVFGREQARERLSLDLQAGGEIGFEPGINGALGRGERESRAAGEFSRPGVGVGVDVLRRDDTIDEAELCSIIGNEVWNDWCAGERVPEESS